MGRKASSPGAIPRLRSRRNADRTIRYYYDHGLVGGRRVLQPLGNNRAVALQLWAEIEGRRVPTADESGHRFSDLATEYRRRELPAKAPATRRLYDIVLTRLQAILGDRALDSIQPSDVAEIWQTTAAKRGTVTANRTKAILSATLNCARVWGMMVQANPCGGVRGRKEHGRKNVLVTDELYERVHAAADQPLKHAMDLADLTGQRPSDVLSLTRGNLIGSHLVLRQGKTGRNVVIEISGALKTLIEQLLAWRGSEIDMSPYLVRDEKGNPLSKGQLRSRFDRARELAQIDKTTFQFRDLRARSVTRKAINEGLEEAQRLAGHSSPNMTAHYSRGARPVKPSR
ncbi:MAG: integrase [Pandoraea sp.]|nr:MAG: integrase [Pandoraea sp.]TAM17045.1 MAG: integrase [Pandoraea sp.]